MRTGTLQRRYRLHWAMVLDIHQNLIRNLDGAIVGIRSFLLDVTERQRAENEPRT